MGKSKNTVITHSNYTYQKKHKSLYGGTIYNRDLTTIDGGLGPIGAEAKDLVPYNAYSPWKIVNNNNTKSTRLYGYGKWTTEGWTINDYINDAVSQETNSIVVKEKSKDLRDYVYYGSARDLVEGSILYIIENFPAQLYCTSNTALGIIDGLTNDKIIMENPFAIDLLNSYETDSSLLEYSNFEGSEISESTINSELFKKYGIDKTTSKLRYFRDNFSEYFVYDADNNIYGGIVDYSKKIYEIDGCLDYYGLHLADVTLTVCNDIERVLTTDTDGKIVDAVFTPKMEDITISIYSSSIDNEYIYVIDNKYEGFSIRPKNKHLNTFFENLPDFPKQLLDRTTTPLFKTIFNNYYWDETGIKYNERNFIWPLSDNWNISISGPGYENYIYSLLSIADFCDENWSNNLWGRMVHDSIKNMDLTHTNPSKNEDSDDYKIGITNFQYFINASANVFDELKRNIDNIHKINSITYNEENNIPDYFLSDVLELSGWDIYDCLDNLDKTETATVDYYGLIDESGYTIPLSEYENYLSSLGYDASLKINDLFNNDSKVSLKKTKTIEYSPLQVSNLFLRELKINSQNILSKKGTRQGIESILGLFGFTSYDYAKKVYEMNYGRGTWDKMTEKQQKKYYDYSINEYVAIAKPNANTPVIFEGLDNRICEINQYKDNAPDIYYSDDDSLSGLLIKKVSVTENGETYNYVIPWYSQSEDYDGDVYYQMYGGWGKHMFDEELENNSSEMYDETVKYIRYVLEEDDLYNIPYTTLENGDIYYVESIPMENDLGTDYSHYFILKDKDNPESGWTNVSKSSIENNTGDGAKVVYLEKIIDDYKANNPHIGFGRYDDGDGYLDYLRQFFKYSIDNSTNFVNNAAFNCDTGDVTDEIKGYGFDIEKEIDNNKCWYFNDKKISDISIIEDTFSKVSVDNTELSFEEGYKEIKDNEIPNVGKKAYLNNETTYVSDFNPYDFENTTLTESNNESASFSIVNIKKMTIKFSGEWVTDNDFKLFLRTAVLPYLRQMIPSTTIWELKIEDEEVDYACLKSADLCDFATDEDK